MSTTTEKNITIANIQIKITGKIFLEHFISNYLGSIIYCPEDYPFGNEDDTVVYLYWTNKNNLYNGTEGKGTIKYILKNTNCH